MSNSDLSGNWSQIQTGVRDAERYIGQKRYNDSMVKSRQTLEFMVKCLLEKYGIAQSHDLIDMIDTLYKSNIISKITCEHYHKIRVIGNKAIHELDENAYNANTAYHLLSQEVYTFANDYSSKRARISNNTKAKKTPNSSPQRPRSTRSRHSKSSSLFNSPKDLLKLFIPVLAVILLLFIIKIVKPSNKLDKISTEISNTMTSAAPLETETVAETIAEDTPPIYKTTVSLNVRSTPSTDGDKLNTLAAGTVVEYLRHYNDEWVVINYDGGEAYVASAYLTTE